MFGADCAEREVEVVGCKVDEKTAKRFANSKKHKCKSRNVKSAATDVDNETAILPGFQLVERTECYTL